MMIATKKLNTLFKSLEREQYRSRDNRENGRYWKTCWETFQEVEKLLRGLMGHWRYPKGNHRNPVESFPEIARFSHVPQYPPRGYFGAWHYIGRDIRFQICTRDKKLHGKTVICVSGFSWNTDTKTPKTPGVCQYLPGNMPTRRIDRKTCRAANNLFTLVPNKDII